MWLRSASWLPETSDRSRNFYRSPDLDHRRLDLCCFDVLGLVKTGGGRLTVCAPQGPGVTCPCP